MMTISQLSYAIRKFIFIGLTDINTILKKNSENLKALENSYLI